MKSLKHATVNDANSLAHLYVEYLREFNIILDREGCFLFLKSVLNDNIVSIIKLELDNEVIGFTAFTKTYSPISMGSMFFINDLFIIASKRGNGYGLELITEIENIARENNIKKIMLNTDKLKSITDLYLKIGYEFTPLTPMSKIL